MSNADVEMMWDLGYYWILVLAGTAVLAPLLALTISVLHRLV